MPATAAWEDKTISTFRNTQRAGLDPRLKLRSCNGAEDIQGFGRTLVCADIHVQSTSQLNISANWACHTYNGK